MLTIEVGFKANTAELQKSLQTITKDLAKAQENMLSTGTMTKDMKEAALAASSFQKALEAASTNKGISYSKLASELKQAGTSIEKTYSNLVKGGATFGNSANVLLRTFSMADRSLISMSTKIQSFAKTFINSAKLTASYSSINFIKSSVKEAINWVRQLDTELNKIQVVTYKNSEQMTEVFNSIAEGANKLQVAAKDYAQVQAIFYQQGLSLKEVETRSEAVVKAASIAGSSYTEMAEKMTAVWNSYAMTSEEMENAAAIAARLGSATAINFEDITTALQKTASVASTVGVSYESMASIIATVGSVTKESASVIGNSYKTILARLTDLDVEGEEGEVKLSERAASLQALGVNILEVNGDLKSGEEILNSIGEAWDTYSTKQQVAIAQLIGGTQQYGRFLSLMNNFQTYQQNLSLASSDDNMLLFEEQYLTSLDTVDKKIEIMTEKWQSAFKDLFPAEAQKGFYEGVGKIGDEVGSMMSDIKDSFLGITGTLGAFLLPTLVSSSTAKISDAISIIGSQVPAIRDKQRKIVTDQMEKSVDEWGKGEKEEIDKDYNGDSLKNRILTGELEFEVDQSKEKINTAANIQTTTAELEKIKNSGTEQQKQVAEWYLDKIDATHTQFQDSTDERVKNSKKAMEESLQWQRKYNMFDENEEEASLMKALRNYQAYVSHGERGSINSEEDQTTAIKKLNEYINSIGEAVGGTFLDKAKDISGDKLTYTEKIEAFNDLLKNADQESSKFENPNLPSPSQEEIIPEELPTENGEVSLENGKFSLEKGEFLLEKGDFSIDAADLLVDEIKLSELTVKADKVIIEKKSKGKHSKKENKKEEPRENSNTSSPQNTQDSNQNTENNETTQPDSSQQTNQPIEQEQQNPQNEDIELDTDADESEAEVDVGISMRGSNQAALLREVGETAEAAENLNNEIDGTLQRERTLQDESQEAANKAEVTLSSIIENVTNLASSLTLAGQGASLFVKGLDNANLTEMGSGLALIASNIIPIITGFTTLSVQLPQINKAIGGFANKLGMTISQLGVWSLVITAVCVGLALLISRIKELNEIEESKTAEGQIKRLNNRVEQLKNTISETSQKIEDLNNSWTNYKTAKDALDQMTVGTKEYGEQLIKVNQTIADMMEKYPELYTQGIISFNGIEGQEFGENTPEGYSILWDIYREGMRNYIAQIKSWRVAEKKDEEKDSHLIGMGSNGPDNSGGTNGLDNFGDSNGPDNSFNLDVAPVLAKDRAQGQEQEEQSSSYSQPSIVIDNHSPVKGASRMVNAAGVSFERTAASFDNLSNANETIATAAVDGATAIETVTTEISGTREIISGAKTEIGVVKEDLGEASQSLMDSASAVKGASRMVNAAGVSFERTAASFDNLSNANETIATAAVDGATAIETAITGISAVKTIASGIQVQAADLQPLIAKEQDLIRQKNNYQGKIDQLSQTRAEVSAKKDLIEEAIESKQTREILSQEFEKTQSEAVETGKIYREAQADYSKKSTEYSSLLGLRSAAAAEIQRRAEEKQQEEQSVPSQASTQVIETQVITATVSETLTTPNTQKIANERSRGSSWGGAQQQIVQSQISSTSSSQETPTLDSAYTRIVDGRQTSTEEQQSSSTIGDWVVDHGEELAAGSIASAIGAGLLSILFGPQMLVFANELTDEQRQDLFTSGVSSASSTEEQAEGEIDFSTLSDEELIQLFTESGIQLQEAEQGLIDSYDAVQIAMQDGAIAQGKYQAMLDSGISLEAERDTDGNFIKWKIDTSGSDSNPYSNLTMEDLQIQLKSTDAEIASYDSTIDSYQSKITQIDVEIGETQEAITQKVSGIITAADETVKKTEGVQSSIETANSDLDTISSTTSTSRQYITSGAMASEAGSNQTGVAKGSLKAVEEGIADTNEKIDTLNSEVDGADQVLEQIDGGLEGVQSSIETANSDLDTISSTTSTSRQYITSGAMASEAGSNQTGVAKGSLKAVEEGAIAQNTTASESKEPTMASESVINEKSTEEFSFTNNDASLIKGIAKDVKKRKEEEEDSTERIARAIEEASQEETITLTVTEENNREFTRQQLRNRGMSEEEIDAIIDLMPGRYQTAQNYLQGNFSGAQQTTQENEEKTFDSIMTGSSLHLYKEQETDDYKKASTIRYGLNIDEEAFDKFYKQQQQKLLSAKILGYDSQQQAALLQEQVQAEEEEKKTEAQTSSESSQTQVDGETRLEQGQRKWAEAEDVAFKLEIGQIEEPIQDAEGNYYTKYGDKVMAGSPTYGYSENPVTEEFNSEDQEAFAQEASRYIQNGGDFKNLVGKRLEDILVVPDEDFYRGQGQQLQRLNNSTAAYTQTIMQTTFDNQDLVNFSQVFSSSLFTKIIQDSIDELEKTLKNTEGTVDKEKLLAMIKQSWLTEQGLNYSDITFSEGTDGQQYITYKDENGQINSLSYENFLREEAIRGMGQNYEGATQSVWTELNRRLGQDEVSNSLSAMGLDASIIKNLATGRSTNLSYADSAAIRAYIEGIAKGEWGNESLDDITKDPKTFQQFKDNIAQTLGEALQLSEEEQTIFGENISSAVDQIVSDSFGKFRNIREQLSSSVRILYDEMVTDTNGILKDMNPEQLSNIFQKVQQSYKLYGQEGLNAWEEILKFYQGQEELLMKAVNSVEDWNSTGIEDLIKIFEELGLTIDENTLPKLKDLLKVAQDFSKLTPEEFITKQYDAQSIIQTLETTGTLNSEQIKTLAPFNVSKESFYQVGEDSFRLRSENPEEIKSKVNEETQSMNDSIEGFYQAKISAIDYWGEKKDPLNRSLYEKKLEEAPDDKISQLSDSELVAMAMLASDDVAKEGRYQEILAGKTTATDEEKKSLYQIINPNAADPNEAGNIQFQEAMGDIGIESQEVLNQRRASTQASLTTFSNDRITANKYNREQAEGGYTDEELMQTQKVLAKMYPDLKKDAKGFVDLSIAVTRAKKAGDAFASNSSKWEEAFDKIEKGEKLAVLLDRDLDSLQQGYADLLGVSKDEISLDFLTDESNYENYKTFMETDDMETAVQAYTDIINGFIDSYRDGMYGVMRSFFQNNAIDGSFTEEVAGQFEGIIDTIQSEIDKGNLDPIKSEEFLASINQLLQATGISAEQFQAEMAKYGYDVDVEQQEVTSTQEMGGATIETELGETQSADIITTSAGPVLSLGVTPLSIKPSKTTKEVIENKGVVTAVGVTQDGEKIGGDAKVKKSSISPKNGSSGSGSKSSYHKPTAKKRYINTENKISDVQHSLSKVSKAKNELYGNNYLEAVKKENNLNAEQARNNLTLAKEAQAYLEKDIADAQTAGLNIQLNEFGGISNQEELENQLADLQDLINTTEDEAAKEAYQKQYDTWETLLNNVIENSEKYRSALLSGIDLVHEWIQGKIDEYTYELSINVNIEERNLTYIDYILKKIGEEGKMSGEAIRLALDKADESAYLINSQIIPSYNKLDELLTKIKNGENVEDDQTAREILGSDVWDEAVENGALEKSIRDKMNELSSQGLTEASSMRDYITSVWTTATEVLTIYLDKFNELTTSIEQQNTILATWTALWEATGEQYEDNEVYLRMINEQIEIQGEKIDVTKQKYNALQEQFDAADSDYQTALQKYNNGEMDGDQLDAIANYRKNCLDNLTQAQTDYYSALQDYISKVTEAETKAAEEIVRVWQEALHGGLQDTTTYDNQDTLNNFFLDEEEKTYSISKLVREIEKAMEDISDPSRLKEYSKYLDEINQKAEDGVQLTETDVSIEEAKLALMKAEDELEDARNNKNTMKLTRDASGNYSYVYSSEDTSDLEQAVDDAYNNWYELVKNAADTASNEWWKVWIEYQEFIANIDQTRYESDEAYRQQVEQTMNYYTDDLAKQADKIIEYNGLIERNFSDTTLGIITDFDSMEELQTNYMEEAENLWADLQTNHEKYAEKMSTVVDELGGDYADLGEAADSAMDDIESNLDSIATKTAEVAEDMSSHIGALIEQIQRVIDSIKEWNETMNSASSLYQTDTYDSQIVSSDQADGKWQKSADQTKWWFGTGNSEESYGWAGGWVKLKWQGKEDWYYFDDDGYMVADDWRDGYYLSPGGAYDPESTINGTPPEGQTKMSQDWKAAEWTHFFSTGGYTGDASVKPTSGVKSTSNADKELANLKYFSTGGYTGNSGVKGVDSIPSMLAPGEYVLNADDTSRILGAVKLIRGMSNISGFDNLNSSIQKTVESYSAFIGDKSSDYVKQEVHIDASFPNVSVASEIEDAFSNLINETVQYITSKQY